MKTETSRVLAYAIDNLDSVKITLTEEYLGENCDEDCRLFKMYRYTVTKTNIEEWDIFHGMDMEIHSYLAILPAWQMFKDTIQGEINGLGECRIKQINLCDSFQDDYEDDLDPYYRNKYYRSATEGDYSPSCPWNAPGMSVHDFI